MKSVFVMIMMLSVSMALLYQQVSRNGKLAAENNQLQQTVVDQTEEIHKQRERIVEIDSIAADVRIQNETIRRQSNELRRALESASDCSGSYIDPTVAERVREYRNKNSDRSGKDS
ncbi:hypothetical protein [Neptuniibacter sp.]|uniref:hypothetical protein n=1 Tax=Neptuniibacter sp. TaxID=1962643 RepID=UPI00262FD689|nr:hypothetical protein [Neptuniibacter sp.]MCP4595745.1 hypothetical protein [Neptuniibacter sp.]